MNLKDITEDNFLDLIAAKNQDKRFYGWLQLHPLFDDLDWESDKEYKHDYKNRRTSEQINLKSKSLLNKNDSDSDMDLWLEMYGGVSKLFDNVSDANEDVKMSTEVGKEKSDQ